MKSSLLDKLCCPIDKSDLKVQIITRNEYDEEEILEGIMTCPKCHRYYPIIYGIPIMTPDEYREFSMEQPVLKRWEKQLNGLLPTNSDFRLLPNGEKE